MTNNEQNDLVSIVIPAYNRQKVIETAINSVLNQTYQNFEIIIADDGSTDNTKEIIEKIQMRDNRVKYLRHKTNRGAQAARNTGIHSANGKWIAFLDSDDQWLEYSLELRLNLAIEKNVSVVHSDCYVLTIENKSVQLFGVPHFEGFIYSMLLKQPGPVFPSLLVAKDALKKIGCLDENLRSYQEWDTSIRLAKHYNFAFCAKPTFIYDCRHEDSLSKDNLRGVQGYEQVVTKFKREIIKYAGYTALSTHFSIIAINYYNLKMKKQFLVYLLRSFFTMPLNPIFFFYIRKKISDSTKFLITRIFTR